MIEPLRISLLVDCSIDHAFETWTQQPETWWPLAHTVTHEPGVRVTFEPRVGGRIFERTPAGAEVEWGRITAWDPPRRLVYEWHIATDPANATEVEIAFTPEGGRTRVHVEHRGWERLVGIGRRWRDANQAGWDGVLPEFVAACRTVSAETRRSE
jgi:uncharacterized protein YndB with AHSA1/START domain